MADAARLKTRSTDLVRGTILVVGGAGYVGAQASKALADIGYLPVVFDNLSTGNQTAVRFGPFERGDIRDAERLDYVFRQYRPLAVIHCATAKSVSGKQTSPHDDYSNIVTGTLSLLEAMRRHSVINLCMLTGAAVYGGASSLAIGEQAPTEPQTAYGACLNAIENIASDFGLASGLRWISLRLFGVGGADLATELGEDHSVEESLIPLAIDATLGRRDHVPILGSHFSTRDGTALRDFVHVKDVAQAICRAVQSLLKQGGLGPYNIGTGQDHSVLEVIKAIETISGLKCPVRYEAKRVGVPFELSADSERARFELGWSPETSDLTSIISSAFVFRRALWTQREDLVLADMPNAQQDVLVDELPFSALPGMQTDHELLLKKLDEFLKD